MELLIAAGSVGVAAGCLLGIFIGTRHVDFEAERAYLTGHVDGYRKAEDDSWMEGLV
jgi:hypothetical protein